MHDVMIYSNIDQRISTGRVAAVREAGRIRIIRLPRRPEPGGAKGRQTMASERELDRALAASLGAEA